VEQVEALVKPALDQANVELVDLTYQKEPAGWTLTFYLDKPGGINLDDCEEWSRRLDTVIEESGLMTHAYNLEVSSPGINRVLKKTADYQRFLGQRAHIRLYAPQDGQKNFHGTLTSADDDQVLLRTEEGKDVRLPRTSIAKSRLDPVIEF
jgi:ribosome maturation factor RimP